MMDVPDPTDPYSRPARRTQWIVSTLAFHYGLDRGVENEIIVLATGLDQYLQEIFHHMDYQGDGKISLEDFHVLCGILGLSKDCEGSECLDSLPSELSFRHFHAKLCGYFSSKAGCQYENGGLLVGKDSEHIETQIRLRSPLKRRERLLSDPPSGCRRGSCTRECYEEIVALEEAEDRISKLEDENTSLRELIEDMRAALQSSDARCLALQVGLWKSHSSHKPEEGCFVGRHKPSPEKPSPEKPNVKNSAYGYSYVSSLQSIIHEIELLRSSQRQMEEATVCTQRLEQELWTCREKLSALEDTNRDLEESNRTLKREQGTMRRRVEEARQALLTGLSKVKELESKASHLPVLQRHISQLQAELQYYRSELPKPPSTRPDPPLTDLKLGQKGFVDSQHDRCSPTGRAVTTPDKMEEQLFRSVEGQAASDEEDDKCPGDQQQVTRLSCCGDRCDDKALKRLMADSGRIRTEESCSAVSELFERVTTKHPHLQREEGRIHMDQLLQELQQKVEELQLELQMLETERVRLLLVEDKLMDILQLLKQLRDQNVSRRCLGKILLSTLESYSHPQHGKAHILEVLNALYHELAACEVLSIGGALTKAQSQQSLDLVITC